MYAASLTPLCGQTTGKLRLLVAAVLPLSSHTSINADERRET
jgi:hypothetical protein